MKDYFKNNYNKLKLPIVSDNNNGLRNAQIGAIHAIASFFTLRKNSAAIIVMPTGSGKTAVLQMAPYFLHSQKVLIVTPSVMVRSQIAEDYKCLDTLKSADVFPANISFPKIYEMENLYDSSIDKELDKSDVVVASAPCALSLSESNWAKDNIDLVEVDEAHHTPAKTWEQILKNLDEVKHILVTATPFRLDKKNLKGELIYTYTLAQAYEDKIFGPIRFIPLSAARNKDIAIAKKAEEIFHQDKQNGFKHYLMVRTASKKNAEELSELYKKETSLKLERVDSSMTVKTIKAHIENLKNGLLDGIICVDMLGEGFDFPNLKIAAIHEPQKSLAATLQFIGRFARTNAKNIGEAKFIAINDEKFKLENQRIFAQNAVWQDMIINLYDHRNRSEEKRKQFISSFMSDTTDSEIIPFSLDSISLNCHVKIYRTDIFDEKADFPNDCFVGNRVYRSKDTIVGIAVQNKSPLWLNSELKINLEYGLFVLHYQRKERLLHIYSHIHSESMYEMLVNAFCPSSTKDPLYSAIPREEMNRVLSDMENFEIFNSGLVNRFGDSGEAYRIMAGSNVSNAINASTGRMYSAGHVFCRAKEKTSQNTLTIGYSSASKVWSSSYLNLLDYINWCEEIGQKINNKKAVVKTNTNLDYLPNPKTFSLYPCDIFYTDFSYKTYSNPVTVYNAQTRKAIGLITDAQIRMINHPGLRVPSRQLKLCIDFGNITSNIEVDCNGKYSSDNTVYITYLEDEVPLADYLTNCPLRVFMFNDSLIEGNLLYKSDSNLNPFDRSSIDGWDWLHQYGTDITDEVGSIQPSLEAALKNDKSNAFIFYDHGSGEMADYITMKNKKNGFIISLYHVKGASHANNKNKFLLI